MNICKSCIHDEGNCKNLLYKKWYAFNREACDTYSTLAKQIGLEASP